MGIRVSRGVQCNAAVALDLRSWEGRTRGDLSWGTESDGGFMTQNSKAIYDLGCILGEVVRWWQEKHPEIRGFEVGYDLWGGPTIGIKWHGADDKEHSYYAHVESLGWKFAGETIPALFDKALQENPPHRSP